MSPDTLVLTPLTPTDLAIEADEPLTPDRLGALGGERAVASVRVWHGRQAAQLGDFYAVRGTGAARLVIEGDARRLDGIGAGMEQGEVVVEGSAGRMVGAGMRGGAITVRGDCGDDAGSGMAGGVLVVEGSAGARVGAAAPGASRGMTGGEIVVAGAAGAQAGRAMRRGLIVVGGDAGPEAGAAAIAGTVIVFGAAGTGSGRWSKRGSLVIMRGAEVPASFRYACTYRPPHVALTLAHLRRRHGRLLAVDDRWIAGSYRRFCGDMAELGKGEILLWTQPASPPAA